MAYTILERFENEVVSQVQVGVDDNDEPVYENMVYKIVNTIVQYNFGDIAVIAEISHFMPQSEQDILLGIQNREIVEAKKLDIDEWR